MLHFKTKQECSNRIRELIYKIGITNKVTDELLLTYVKQHPRWNDTDVGIEQNGQSKYLRVYFAWSPTTSDERRAWATTSDERRAPYDVISWESILSPPTLKSIYTKALRNSISDQVKLYRASCTNIHCEWCENTEQIEVDHIYEFKNIVVDFEKKYGFPIPAEYTKNSNFYCCFRDEEKEIELTFQNFHQEVATYRLLCKSCNVGRNKKFAKY